MSKIIRPKGGCMVVLPGIIKVNEEENAEKQVNSVTIRKIAELYT